MIRGVTAAREVIDIPIIGLNEPSVSMALLVNEEATIITTDWYGVTCMRRKSIQGGYSQRLGKIIPLDLRPPVFDEGELISKTVEICRELEKEKIRTAVLGCGATMFAAKEIKDKVKDEGIEVQLIEPVSTSLILLEAIIRLGLQTGITSTDVPMMNLNL